MTTELTARAIVARAAVGENGKDHSASEWLRRDELGRWEALAQTMLDKTAEARASLGISDEDMLEQSAVRLALLALQAMLAEAKARPAKAKKR